MCYQPTLTRAWTTLTVVRAPRDQPLPVILSPAEGRPILAPLKLLRSRVCLTPIDSYGLRLQDRPPLQVPARESARLLVHGRCGTGAQDRSVPLPQRPLAWLRDSGTTHRHPGGLCPAPGRSGLGMATASAPMPRPRVQDALRTALPAHGCHTRAAVHTLRHPYATPLLEASVHLRLMHASVGHDTPTTTALSTPLTATADARAREPLAGLLGDRAASRRAARGEWAKSVQRHGPADRAKLQDRLLPSHLAAMQAIAQCRTAALGRHGSQCAEGGEGGVQRSCLHASALPHVSQ